MQSITANKNDAGQRLDKFLAKYLNQAPKSFLYKMLRKKNITLNGKKASGNEILALGDEIKLFFSDDTITKFQGKETKEYPFTELDIVYEDSDLIFLNKPVGMLSQKAEDSTPSMVEYLIGYLLKSGSLNKEALSRFKPSVCNRLDRNTSGLIVAGKSLQGLQFLSGLLKDRTLGKYYYALVKGVVKKKAHIKGVLVKNAAANRVYIELNKDVKYMNEQYIETSYEPIASSAHVTLLKVKLITGKTHQIRAHLSSIGHPIVGDYKYGDSRTNEFYKKKYGLTSQLLHAHTLIFPDKHIPESFSYLSGKKYTANVPELFSTILNGEGIKER